MTVINEKGAFDIRAGNKSDLNYILNSWLMTYKESPEMNLPGLVNEDYFSYQHRMLDVLISRSSAAGSLLVCHQTGAPEVIRGYLVAEVFEGFPCVHWLQVKRKEQRKGVAEALLKQLYLDFDISPGNLVYTFSSKDLRNHSLQKIATDRWQCVYLPWFKYTTIPAGWEA